LDVSRAPTAFWRRGRRDQGMCSGRESAGGRNRPLRLAKEVRAMSFLIGVRVLGAAVAALGVTASAQSTAPEPLRNKAAIERAFAAWKDGTGSPLDLLADDAVWTIVGRTLVSKTYDSREAFMRDVIRPFNARMSSGLKPEVRHLYADGNTVVAFFEARGVARDGKPYENTYAWFMTMRDGRIVRVFAFLDSVAFNDLWTRLSPDDSE
jgi:ketosteroid isomerase-like protein